MSIVNDADGRTMINIPNSDVNNVTTFAISHITNNHVCLVHKQHAFDKKNDIGMENRKFVYSTKIK